LPPIVAGSQTAPRAINVPAPQQMKPGLVAPGIAFSQPVISTLAESSERSEARFAPVADAYKAPTQTAASDAASSVRNLTGVVLPSDQTRPIPSAGSQANSWNAVRMPAEARDPNRSPGNWGGAQVPQANRSAGDSPQRYQGATSATSGWGTNPSPGISAQQNLNGVAIPASAKLPLSKNSLQGAALR
jgi:hypothetical protein